MTQSRPVETPDLPKHEAFDTAEAAVERLQLLYKEAAEFLPDTAIGAADQEPRHAGAGWGVGNTDARAFCRG